MISWQIHKSCCFNPRSFSQQLGDILCINGLPSGNLKQPTGKRAIEFVDFPNQNGDFHSYVGYVTFSGDDMVGSHRGCTPPYLEDHPIGSGERNSG